MVERVACEALGLVRPGFADELVRCEAFQRREAPTEVVGGDEVSQVGPELVVVS